MSHPLIELQDITRTYHNGELAVPVLRGINLAINRGEFVAIMGASGSGKSTLMNILGCLDRPSTGQYWFDGQDVSKLNSDGLARLRRESFGFVFQSYNLLPGISASENVEMPASYASLRASERQGRAAKLLQRLGLDERMGHRPGQLSGGQQQRVSIARALMNGGEIILADEPTGALDSHSGREVMKLLKELSAEGYTIILITHDSNVAEHAHRMIEIADGQIVSDPGPMAVLSDAPLKRQPLKHKPSIFRELYQGARTAIHSMLGNLFRTALTLLGIVIGVASVITMLAIGDGAREAVVDRISAMGSNLLLVRPGTPGQGRGGWNIATLVPEDVSAINTLPNITAAIPELTGNQTFRYGNADHQAEVNATSWQFPVVRQWPVVQGSFFDEADEDEYAPVAVLGKTSAQALFGSEDPVGRYIMMNNVLFQVIGVMSERGAYSQGAGSG